MTLPATTRADAELFREPVKGGSSEPAAPGESRGGRGARLRLPSIVEVLAAALFVAYCVAFCWGLKDYWFDRVWTTDDALQQSYPFHKVTNPDLFAGDPITKAMEGYLTPVHYGLWYGITLLTRDPVMTGHWVMLIQCMLAMVFMVLAVRAVAGNVAACFAGTWFMHTRHIMQRLTGGLPRGWGAVILTGYLFFLLTKRHRAMIAFLVVGCALHPPTTLLVAIAYGTVLLVRAARPETRAEYWPHLKRLAFVSPLCVVLAFYTTQMPEEIGTMASYEQALAMPEFNRPWGRFPFVPFRPAFEEIRSYAFQAFVTRFFNPGHLAKKNMWWISFTLLAAFIYVAIRRRKSLPYLELATFGGASFVMYFASRAFAFKLYVPDRHLQFPMGIFFVTALTVAAWRAFYGYFGERPGEKPYAVRRIAGSVLALTLVGMVVFWGSGSGLYGAANFNQYETKRGKVWVWLRKYTPENSLIAGHPTFMDPVQLFGQRRALITTETAHPFYDRYYNEIVKPRLEVSLRAHYAKTLAEMVQVLDPHGVDYFVFDRALFFPASLREASYYPPHDTLVKELTSGDALHYAYRELPREVDVGKYPFMPFRDSRSVVVDIAKLKEYLAAHGGTVDIPGSRGSVSAEDMPLPAEVREDTRLVAEE